LQYVIFPAQFAFLYSYHPSGRMDDAAKKLTEEWRLRHVESSERAFSMKDGGFVREVGPSFFQKSEVPETVLAAARGAGDKKK
jgi:zeaxanthin epoxidase